VHQETGAPGKVIELAMGSQHPPTLPVVRGNFQIEKSDVKLLKAAIKLLEQTVKPLSSRNAVGTIHQQMAAFYVFRRLATEFHSKCRSKGEYQLNRRGSVIVFSRYSRERCTLLARIQQVLMKEIRIQQVLMKEILFRASLEMHITSS